jgi:cytochrome c553
VIRLASVILGVLVFLALASLAFIYSGLYNVAATTPHTDIVWWALDTLKVRAIKHRANAIAAPRLDEEAALRAAGQYHFACAPCHGAPGFARGQMGDGLNPEPPDLARSLARWSQSDLFWIVKHGIKFTGMPGWAPTHRDDEIWAFVAFIDRLPGMSPAQYRRWTGLSRQDAQGETVVTRGGEDPAALACAICHGAAGTGGGEIPRLAGQSRQYLLETLRQYAGGTRRSGIMEPISRALTSEEMESAVRHYADLAAAPRVGSGDAAALQRGGVISAAGVPSQRIAACASCHGIAGRNANGTVPNLAGQPAAYLSLQLRLWKTGVRTDSPMREIAARLTEQQIVDVSEYFARLPQEM